MSAVAAAAVPRHPDGGRRPGYWLVLRRVLLGQVLGSMSLLLIAVALSWTPLVNFDLTNFWMYAPWILDGAWSVFALIGWGLLVVALIGTIVRREVERRTAVGLSRLLTMLAVAIGGYAPPILFTQSSGARVALSVLLTPALLLLFAFDAAGRPRRLAAAAELSGRRFAALLLACAVVLAAPFAVLHPLRSYAATDSSSANPSGVRAGEVIDLHNPVELTTALQSRHFAITVTGVDLLGTRGALRVDRRELSLDSPPTPFNAPSSLPLRLAPGHGLWISYRLTLERCVRGSLTLDAVRVHYRMLGLSLEQAVPLDQATTLLPCFG